MTPKEKAQVLIFFLLIAPVLVPLTFLLVFIPYSIFVRGWGWWNL